MVGYSWGKKSSTWKVDHELDDMRSYASDSESRKSFGPVDDNQPVLGQLETPEEKKARRRSHLVAYTTMFVMSIGFSIVLSGVWPYLKQIDNSLEKDALGWVVAANPLGQMLASPLLGIWGNKAGSIRGACIVTVLFFIGGNVMYATLYAFKDAGKNVAYYMMIVARFIVGVSSANVTLCRSYLAGSTTLEERTTGIAVIAAAQAMGFVVGPVIQAVLTVAVPNSSSFPGLPGLVWDKYTSAGWVAALLGFINLIIVMPCIFQEHYIAEKEFKMKQAANPNGMNQQLPKPDYLGVFSTCYGFGMVIYMTSVRETIATPLVADQYGVSDSTAVFSVSIALSVAGFISVFIFIASARLTKMFDERKVLILMGFIPVVVGVFAHYPIGTVPIHIANCSAEEFSNGTTAIDTTTPAIIGKYIDVSSVRDWQVPVFLAMNKDVDNNTVSECLGCPTYQTWCATVRQITPPQLIVSYFITILGYPIAMSLTQTTFSKILGPAPQGLWMGILTGSGSLARVTGPLWISVVYEKFGTIYTYMILGILESSATLVLTISFKRLAPMDVHKVQKTSHDNAVAKMN